MSFWNQVLDRQITQTVKGLRDCDVRAERAEREDDLAELLELAAARTEPPFVVMSTSQKICDMRNSMKDVRLAVICDEGHIMYGENSAVSFGWTARA